VKKYKKVASLIRQILEVGKGVESVFYDRVQRQLLVRFVSAHDWVTFIEDTDLPIIFKQSYTITDMESAESSDRYAVNWDCDQIDKGKRERKQFDFSQGVEKRARGRVTEQEEEGAGMIGGERHVGSGAISGLKSDASSKVWQQEAKQTASKSFRVTLNMLAKISEEARLQGKRAMVFLRFTEVPDVMNMEEDWILIPRSAFEAKVK